MLHIEVHSFNRYIVECKYTTSFDVPVKVTSFNRYIVECKYLWGKV